MVLKQVLLLDEEKAHQKLFAKNDCVWELGSPTPALFASMSAVIDYVCWLGSYDSIGDGSRRDLYLRG
ncbi:hypothetical protein GW626_18460 [Peribacillus muralis]|uniref:hypothetical protein n=1 Tax=Peribacillus muralis TaxID=264697 RepID=UPI001F4F0DD2|nr:hypothetical protein [Peribacillus muralis]MCK1992339.1 hypothetical protein [Peribacillus muralis]MCK2012895.1 hypothetical protein [Peribacillus muralis]